MSTKFKPSSLWQLVLLPSALLPRTVRIMVVHSAVDRTVA